MKVNSHFCYKSIVITFHWMSNCISVLTVHKKLPKSLVKYSPKFISNLIILINKQLSFNETLNIMTDLEKYPTEVQKEFLEFYIKNVSMHRQNVFRNFLSIKDKATTYKMTDLDTKRLSKVHIQNYLKSKKVN